MKLDLLTNATVVDYAIRFVSEVSKDNVKDQVKSSPSFLSDSSNEDDNKESKEPDYDDEKSDKEGEEKQEVCSMNNITKQHYILYPFATLHKVYDKCSGKGCTDIGKTPLKIVYINKTGYLCDSCSEDLLHEGLLVQVGKDVIY